MLELLREAVEHFPTVFDAVKLPRSSKELKNRYSALLVEVEQRRCAASERAEIARFLQRRVAERCSLRSGAGDERPLSELGLATDPLPVDHLHSSRAPGWTPSFRYRDKQWLGKDIVRLVDELESRHRTNAATAAALRRALDRLDDDGALRLPGERFALFGAGAEIAPTRALLQAGATVLWTDVVPPGGELRDLGGELYHANGRSDLLLCPDQVASTVAEFAGHGAAHVGLFAYGPGQGREWRLGAAMNAALRALPRELVHSVGLFISPTTPILLDEDDAVLAEERQSNIGGWKTALVFTRVLVRSRALPNLPRVSDSIVPLQGVSYQAAQWLEKTIAMEAIGADNPDLPISANVAPVTETTSMNHPVFQAAFRGAPAFEVESFMPEVTRTLSTLLYIEDVLGDKPTHPRHLHGGVLPMPFSLESALKVAAAAGVVKRRR